MVPIVPSSLLCLDEGCENNNLEANV